MTQTTTEVRPYIGMIAIVDPPASASTNSGIILPPGTERIRKGIVVGVGPQVPELEEGCVVWTFRDHGTEIEGITFLDHSEVIAFQEKL